MHNNLAYRSQSGGPSVSNLARNLADVRPERVAKIRRPQVAKRPWRTTGEPFDPAKVAGAPATTR